MVPHRTSIVWGGQGRHHQHSYLLNVLLPSLLSSMIFGMALLCSSTAWWLASCKRVLGGVSLFGCSSEQWSWKIEFRCILQRVTGLYLSKNCSFVEPVGVEDIRRCMAIFIFLVWDKYRRISFHTLRFGPRRQVSGSIALWKPQRWGKLPWKRRWHPPALLGILKTSQDVWQNPATNWSVYQLWLAPMK